MRSTSGRGAGARCAVVVGLLALTGCGGPSTTPGGAAAEVAQGRLAFFGALPDDRSSGALVLDLATGEQVRVGDQQEAWSAAWAGPDHLAVVRGVQRIRDDGPGELVLAAADGSDAGTPIGGVVDVREVASSSDGQHLALLGRTGTSSGACLDPAPSRPMGLYVAAADGSGVRRVADVASASGSLVLSPDGSTAALLDHGDDAPVPAGRDWCDPGDVRLVLIDTATGASRVVEGVPEIAEAPRFSPDGASLVLNGGDFATTPERDLVFVDVASATAERLRTPGTAETAPVFSPDGRRLAVLRHTTGGDPATTATIAVGDADGTGLRDVVATGTQDHDLVWTTDGSHLVVVGSVVEMACGDDAGVGATIDLAAAPGGCDVATSTSDVRVVSAAGGDLRRVSDAVSGSDAGLTPAP